jgi:outer membrane lipoprotein LolB
MESPARMPLFIKKLLIFILPILVLVGCEAVPTPPHSVEWQAHQTRLASLTHFQVTGKLGYIDDTQRQSLNFVWDHSPTATTIKLNTFFGKNVLTLTLVENGAKLTLSSGETYFDSSADALVKKLTGMQIPVSDMKHWIKGDPKNATQYTINELNSLASLTKQSTNESWQLSYDNYRTVEDYLLPQTLKLSQIETSQHNVKLNIAISKWNLH